MLPGSLVVKLAFPGTRIKLETKEILLLFLHPPCLLLIASLAASAPVSLTIIRTKVCLKVTQLLVVTY